MNADRACAAWLSSGGHDPETCPNQLLGRAETFRWLRREFEVSVEPAASGEEAFLRLDLESAMTTGEQFLSFSSAPGTAGGGLWLAAGRRVYPIRLPGQRGRTIRFRLSRTVPDDLRPGDPRELGVKLHGLELAAPDAAWLAPRPQVVVVEPTSRCNSACLTCCHSVEGPGRPAEFPDEWIGLLEPLAAGALSFRLQGLGEPLLARSFPRLMALLPASRPVAIFSSNLSIMTDGMEDLIFRGQVREVSVSLDAATPETYRLIRGREFAPVLGNIRRLVARRRRLSRTLPEISLSMTLMRMNVREAPAFVSLARELGADRIVLRHLLDDPRHGWTVERDGFRFVYGEQHLDQAADKGDALVAEALARSVELGVRLERPHHRAPVRPGASNAQGPRAGGAGLPDALHGLDPRDCPLPWHELHFRTDGVASFCCWQAPPGLPRLGEVAHVVEIWNSPAAQWFRAELAANRLPAACRGADCRYARNPGAGHA